jgi:hypothetical protein
MHTCRIVPVHAPTAGRFSWEWRSDGCKQRSKGTFGLFYDCVEDAQRHGFKVLLNHPTGANAPGRHALMASTSSGDGDRSYGTI